MKVKELIAIIGAHPELNITAQRWDKKAEEWVGSDKIVGVNVNYDELGSPSYITLEMS